MKLKVYIPGLFYCLLIAISGLGFVSCGDTFRQGKHEEGIIEFDTRAVDEKHPLFGFAPSTATLKFKKNKFIIEMSTMGMFNTTIIGDTKANTIVQTIKFMNIKQACIERENDLKEENRNYLLKIEETGETKMIAGLKCHKLLVTKLNNAADRFEAWYTKELGLEDCNALTPYSSVKGMLMDYRIEKMGMEMHFTAKSYQNAEVPDQTFEIPASMKIVDKGTMKKFFEDLQ